MHYPRCNHPRSHLCRATDRSLGHWALEVDGDHVLEVGLHSVGGMPEHQGLQQYHEMGFTICDCIPSFDLQSLFCLKKWKLCKWWDSNPQPTEYKVFALLLCHNCWAWKRNTRRWSYLSTRSTILNGIDAHVIGLFEQTDKLFRNKGVEHGSDQYFNLTCVLIRVSHCN